ncbi:LysE family translocator [Sinorhizobium chiapasense]|uniref:Threonine/homoserine/homoserine lactone efflux protein n=1 Tax=Sinorhizobium chiapasense TaxID=501572 RepID=A0ABZ2BFD0_9HYPH
MTYNAYVFAVLALLATPGPTNTLMGLAAARKGLRCTLQLLPAELAGYFTMIMPLTLLGTEMVSRWPAVAVLVKATAASWILYVAIKLWRVGGNIARDHEITIWRVYLTTMLNPKALILALVLLPSPTDQQFLPRLGVFGLLAIAVAFTWGGLGTLLGNRQKSGSRLLVIQRISSVWLAIISATLIAGIVHG